MKKIYFYVIALWSVFFVTSGFAQCTFSELAKDFSRNTALKDFVKTDAKAFDAWYLLNKEKPSLRNSLPEVKIVAENFQEVKNAGGYQKWIDKLSTEEKNVPILFLDSQQKFEQTVDVSNLPKHLRSLAYQYYKKANNENKLHLWQRLEEIFEEYKINGNWPPYNGGYNIESGISLQKFQKHDRYANPIGSWDGINEPLLGGNFTSPIINDQPFDFSSRALNIPESNYTFYYEIEILEDLGFDGELADVIPWFKQKGQGKQVKWNIPKDPTTGRPKTWNKLAEEGKVRITIKDIPNGNPELIKKWKGYVIGKKVQGAGNLVPSSLITKLTQQGATKLKAWTSGKSLNLVDDAGNVLTGASAEAKIFQKLDDAIGNQNVLGTFEDAQGRLLVQCEGANRNTVYGVLTNKNGQQVVYKFEPAYKPSANPSIPVPLSANKLAPDFATTQYLYPIAGAEKNIVKIKMTGNRTSDFVKSNQAAGLGNSATTPSKIVNGVEVKYTWHHLDDFDPVTGECTMQLVETSAHSTVGMTHTGSVGQYKSFNGSGY